MDESYNRTADEKMGVENRNGPRTEDVLLNSSVFAQIPFPHQFESKLTCTEDALVASYLIITGRVPLYSHFKIICKICLHFYVIFHFWLKNVCFGIYFKLSRKSLDTMSTNSSERPWRLTFHFCFVNWTLWISIYCFSNLFSNLVICYRWRCSA